jgi:hypothetical protein
MFHRPSDGGETMLETGRMMLIAFFCCGLLYPIPPRAETDVAQPVQVQMRNVNFWVDRNIVLEIHRLRGEMVPTQLNRPVTFDDGNSFITRVDTAEIVMSAASLSNLLNGYIFADSGAPLKHIRVTISGGRLKQTGTMHKGIDVPFEVEGSVSSTPDGNIRIHADKIRSAHIPFKGLLHLFGEDLSKLINLKGARGLRLEGDDILMFPSQMLPSPRIEGRIASVRLEEGAIVQVFDSGKRAPELTPPFNTRNYIYHRGGVLRFGKLTMTDVDLEIVDDDQKTPFDFFLRDYDRQLAAGYSKNTLSHGLIVHMPDYGRVDRGVAQGRQSKKR